MKRCPIVILALLFLSGCRPYYDPPRPMDSVFSPLPQDNGLKPEPSGVTKIEKIQGKKVKVYTINGPQPEGEYPTWK